MTSRAAKLLSLLLMVLLCAAAMPQAVASGCAAMAQASAAQATGACEKLCCPQAAKAPSQLQKSHESPLHHETCLAACTAVAAPLAEDRPGTEHSPLREPLPLHLAGMPYAVSAQRIHRPAKAIPRTSTPLAAPLRI